MVNTRRVLNVILLGIICVAISGCAEFLKLFDEVENEPQGPTANVAGAWVGKSGPIRITGIGFPISIITGETYEVNSIPLRLDLTQGSCTGPFRDRCSLSGTMKVRALGEKVFQVLGDITGSRLRVSGDVQPVNGAPIYTAVLLATVSSDGNLLSGEWSAIRNESVVKSGNWSAHKSP